MGWGRGGEGRQGLSGKVRGRQGRVLQQQVSRGMQGRSGGKRGAGLLTQRAQCCTGGSPWGLGMLRCAFLWGAPVLQMVGGKGGRSLRATAPGACAIVIWSRECKACKGYTKLGVDWCAHCQWPARSMPRQHVGPLPCIEAVGLSTH